MPPAHLALVENPSTEETHHADTDTGFSQKLPDVVRTMGLLDGDQIENLKNQARAFRLPFEDLLDHSGDLSAESLTLAKSRATRKVDDRGRIRATGTFVARTRRVRDLVAVLSKVSVLEAEPTDSAVSADCETSPLIDSGN